MGSKTLLTVLAASILSTVLVTGCAAETDSSVTQAKSPTQQTLQPQAQRPRESRDR